MISSCDEFKSSQFEFWRRKWQPTPVLLPGEFHDRGVWQATVLGVTKSRAQLSDSHTHTQFEFTSIGCIARCETVNTGNELNEGR